MWRVAWTAAGVLLLMQVPGLAAAAQASPVTTPDSAVLEEDTVVVVYPLLNDSDPAGGSLELVEVSASPAGETRIDGPAVVFVPAPDWNGEVELTYLVRGAGGEAAGQIFLTVTPVNDPPVAVDDAAEAVADEPVTVDVLANDVDIDGDALSIAGVGASGNGSAEISAGLLRYTAAAGFSGVDEIAYTIEDPDGATAEAILTVAVTLPAPTTTFAVPPASSAPPTTTAAPTTTATTPPTTVPVTAAPLQIAVDSPGWAAPDPGLVPPETIGGAAGFSASARRAFDSLYLPLLTLMVVGIAAWLLSRRGDDVRAHYAVVLVGLEETLPVYERPGAAGKILHHYAGSTRQIERVGPKRAVSGVTWVLVASPGGQGWVNAAYLTEDVARASFAADVVDADLVRRLRTSLKEGSTIATSPRGPIDPECFTRDAAGRRLGGHATSVLAALVGDWRATFHIDGNAALGALRPPQLRNLHWISFEAPGREAWQLFFEYHDGAPYPVAALPEKVPVTAG